MKRYIVTIYAVILSVALVMTLFSINIFADENQNPYYESPNNSQTIPDTIPISYISGDESHVYGTISSSTDSDWYTFQPLRHGRIFVMVLCDGTFYNVDVYKCETYEENIYSNTYTTFDCIADISFMVTRDSVNNNNMPTYKINIRSYNGSYNTSKNYHIIVFYAIYNYPGESLSMIYPLPLSENNNLRITSAVGKRTYDNSYHIGTDIGAWLGTTLYSVDDAFVAVSEKHIDYGNRVFLILDTVDPYDAGNNINARYYHLNSRSVSVNTQINKGNVIGTVGYDGLAGPSSTHLHIDFNYLPESSPYRFSQSYLESNPQYVINLVDLFPTLQFWSSYSNYVYINP